jgi:hypothetical protein
VMIYGEFGKNKSQVVIRPIIAIFKLSFLNPKLSCIFFAKKIKIMGVMAKNRFQTRKKPKNVPVL